MRFRGYGQIVLLFAVCLPTNSILFSPAKACKYTVRDVAFVTLIDKEYRLDLFLADSMPEETVSRITSIAQSTVSESNVSLHVVRQGPIDAEDAKTQERLKRLGIDTLPAAALVAPDQKSKKIALPADLLQHPEKIEESLATILQSQRAAQVMARLAQVHSIVLIVESNNAEQNERALKMVRSAIAEIKSSLAYLPKPIDLPPEILTLTTQEAQRESFLLWSLGIKVDVEKNTQIVYPRHDV